jgi:hypothetical protein
MRLRYTERRRQEICVKFKRGNLLEDLLEYRAEYEIEVVFKQIW